MLRRAFLLTPVAVMAQARRSGSGPVRVELVLDATRAEGGVVCPRAFVASTVCELNRSAIRTGKFPHAIQAGDPSIDALLTGAGASRGTIAVTTKACGPAIQSAISFRFDGVLRPRLAEELLVSHADIFPTVLGLSGLPIPEGVQGRDLSLALQGKGEAPDSVYIQGPDWRAVVRGFDKLVADRNGAALHQFNLADDPEEQTDLVHESAGQLTRDALLALVKQWMRKLGDGVDPSGLKLRP